MSVFSAVDYKQAVRSAIKERQLTHNVSTLRLLARKIKIQYTYLSKVLNSDHLHLNEDAVYAICSALALDERESEFLLLLRARDATTLVDRRDYIARKLEAIREANKVSSKTFPASGEKVHEKVLLNPFGLLVLVAMTVPKYRKEPGLLRRQLQMSETKFDDLLRDLESANCLRLERSGEQLAIDAVTSTSIHFQPEDPLVGAHQLLVRQQAEARKSLTDPDKKTSFQVTFTGDAATFEKCRASFRAFIRDIQKISEESAEDRLFFLQFDLHPWFEA